MAEDPTNIIKRDEPATRVEGRSATSRDAGERHSAPPIKFTCGNGHPIVVPAKLAGKRGTCSRCGIQVVIPLAGGRGGMVATDAVGPPPEETVEEAATTPEEPAVEPAAGEAEGLPDFSGIADGESQPAESADVPSQDEFEGFGAAAEARADSFEPDQPSSHEREMEGIDNPTAVLVAKLFGECEHGGVVEVHLKSGQIVMPLLFDFQWSRGTHGLFASENKADGTITLTAVAWDAVEQVIVRKVKGLPEGMFEEP